MINFDFDYYRPASVEEAFDLYTSLTADGKKVLYYAGGTELTTSFRKGVLRTDAVIDLKSIEALRSYDDKHLEIGACVDLNTVGERVRVMSPVIDQLADHTTRNAITIGGNLCGRLPYKEVVLPLLAMDVTLQIYNGSYIEKPLSEVFSKRLKLTNGEILCKIKIGKLNNYVSKRLVESTNVDYPILHLLVSEVEKELFVGLSAFSSGPVYHTFNTRNIDEIISYFEKDVRDSIKGSADYKLALLKDSLNESIKELEVQNA
jgi:CO/xanthine dehydrogenase FAD-binding subunit